MPRELADTPALHRGVPYSYAAIAPPGDTVFTAGACPIDSEGRVASPGDLVSQTRLTLDNLTATLHAAGCALEDVVKTTVYVASADRSDYTPPGRSSRNVSAATGRRARCSA